MAESPKNVTACLLIIGNEILSGRTKDANLNFLALELNKLGVQLRECRVIPDVEQTVVDTVNEVRRKFDYVFTTGGIGPTHDDITADCIAKAFGVGISEHRGSGAQPGLLATGAVRRRGGAGHASRAAAYWSTTPCR